ncbi:RusA-like Holliday junction resolvase [Mycobacterium phage Lolly9]|uniref:RusA-like resolvase n=1 Tax=Mycobacterium phage Lolly9 TaxID=1698711 RepID=A0A0K2FNC4_9CAUD|nr:RusA-like Holliday junction resolvase [Mycobacterium phage Lolly9]ALA48494.1 RusA-like resolvase [Mycobacterium phage Lolly9]QOP65806.1 RusA-like resolvase [Mycobacterium phage MiniLon]QOP66553.1 RusA-like resolvase [Mycobacterium phage MiniMac]
MEHRLTVPFKRPPMTANDQRRAHWAVVAKAKKQVGDVVEWQARRAGIKDLGPSVVSVLWYTPTKRATDSDSLGPFVKGALDGLVRAGVWPDDNSRYVKQTCMAVSDGDTKNPRIEIRIREVGDTGIEVVA